MLTWKVLFLCMLPCYQAEKDGIFECGAHGRFEYCIDGIPGCVIGCHCHPGYYFDTETKICETNTKLTQNYRRKYMPEPTRVQNPNFLENIPPTERFPSLTTRNIIDEHVNDITKNADDLGDWLYNQFFKTIENQIINNTSKNSLTRRSGRAPKRNKLKLRARKKGKKHKKKTKGLRGKLLRITEDDSLFQSSMSSESDSSSSDFTRSDSFESDSDEDHGHKKIIMYKKKPKPPLPSFIFLPNINTPYYPPIGLPPPPVMPMYPIVPVPPMMPAPPPMPYPGCIPECQENTTVITTTTGAVITSTEAPASITEKHEDLPADMQVTTREPLRGRRQKPIKLLRQKLNYPRIGEPSFKRHRKPFDKYMNQLTPPDIFTDNDLSENIVPKNENSSPYNLEDTPELENVDFKYLSQLIHRVNENQTQGMPVYDYNLQDSPKASVLRKWSNKRYGDFKVPLDSGRRTHQYINTSRNYQADDSYYSNLGKQIATLIRTIDADKERQFNIEIEKVQQKTNDHPYFNENGARTFWERSVRSPLRFFHSFKNRFDKLKNSNELLFNIENKVETIASTMPPLSLQELENLINIMETARTQFKTNNKIKNSRPFTKNFNVNLWPQDVKQSKKTIKSFVSPNDLKIKRRKSTSYSNNTRSEVLNNESNNANVRNVYPFTNRVKMNKINDVFIKHGSQVQPSLTNATKMHSQPIFKPQYQKALPSSENRRHAMNPTILNYKNIKKYFFDNNNQYSFQNDDLRLNYSPALRSSKQQMNSLVPSPYFHHEINHIDYIP